MDDFTILKSGDCVSARYKKFNPVCFKDTTLEDIEYKHETLREIIFKLSCAYAELYRRNQQANNA